MAQLLSEIQWSEPVVPAVSDPAWEAEVKRRMGTVAEIYRRIAPLPWLREASLRLECYRPVYLSARLANIGAMVTAQENSCRYCYGATRAFLKILGYRESFIDRIERDMQLAELDEREHAFIRFCRNLARSSPRPARAEREALVKLGFPPLAVAEMAFFIALLCFYNRVATLVACPPEAEFERFVSGPLGRVVGLFGPLLRPLMNRRPHAAAEPAHAQAEPLPFDEVIAALDGLPAAELLRWAMHRAFESTVLPRRTKALMFAVVARSLECGYCEGQARQALAGEGFSAEEAEASIASLTSPRLEPFEVSLLNWVRSTVHYVPSTVQEQTRALVQEIGDLRALEAVGMASLANAVVRLAMLLE